MNTGTLLAYAAAASVASFLLGARNPRLWLALVLGAAAAGFGASWLLLSGAADWEWRGEFSLGGERAHLRLDGVSSVFLALLCVVAAAGAVYARGYWSDRERPRSAPLGRVCWSAMIANMGLALLCSNGLHFLIAWELFTLSAWFLIRLDNRLRAAREAAWLYLAASHVATLFLFAFFASLAARTGSWELDAPSHVSAILSGVAIKMGVYGIVRFSGWLPLPVGAGWVVIGLGALSALAGITFALAQNDLKRLLAYCSVEHVGVILIGVGAALLTRAQGGGWGRLALAGALLHVWNHGAFKPLLFFGAGSVLHATGTREMSRLGGLWRVMPWTAGLFALASIAVAGLPPLNGFVSEWLLYLGLFDAAASKSDVAWAALPVAVVLAASGALALATFVKASSVVFLGSPRTRAAEHAHECGAWMRAPMLVLASVCVALALAPMLVGPALARAVGTWNPAWARAGAPAPLQSLACVHVVVACLAALAALGLWRMARANGLRRAPTWDCGFARPTARMQYTSGSFAGIVGDWSGWLLRTARRYRRPRGPFPQRSERIERLADSVLARLLAPAGAGLMRASFAARRLQHGRLQAYILYLVVGLAGLAGLVLLGART